ncbi:zf-CCHC domain-containing protein [Tanacetum coccineum]
MMLDSIDNGPQVYPTVEENGQTRPMKYSELTKAQQLQDDCDFQATNITLHGLPPYVVKHLTQYSQADFPQLDFGLAVPTFHQGEDPIECINKAMALVSAMSSRGIAATSRGNYVAGQPRVVKCYNCQGEGHMARQCTQPKRPRNAAWFKEKLMLAEAQEAGQIMDEEQLAFLADPRLSEALDCDDLSSAKAVLMENLSSCDSDVLSKDTNPSAPNDLLVLSLVEQMTDYVAHLDKENQINKMVNESLTAELERYKERIAIFDQRLNVDLNKREKLIDSQMDDLIQDRNAKLAAFQQEINTLKETLSNNVKENESL